MLYTTGNWDEVIGTLGDNLKSKSNIFGLRANSSQILSTFDNDEFMYYHVWMSDVCENYPMMNVEVYVWNYDNEGKIDGIEGNVTLVKSALNYTKLILDDF